jgi:hypothetical protein
MFPQDSLRTKNPEFLLRKVLQFPVEKDWAFDLVEALRNEVESVSVNDLYPQFFRYWNTSSACVAR